MSIYNWHPQPNHWNTIITSGVKIANVIHTLIGFAKMYSRSLLFNPLFWPPPPTPLLIITGGGVNMPDIAYTVTNTITHLCSLKFYVMWTKKLTDICCLLSYPHLDFFTKEKNIVQIIAFSPFFNEGMLH